LDIIQYLAQHGHVKIEIQNMVGSTALYEASYYIHFNVVQYLTHQCCANINTKENDRSTVLCIVEMVQCRSFNI
jgi:hypothetical protein